MSRVDEQAAVLASRVAASASAWLNAPDDTAAYRRLVDAVRAWEDYRQPSLADAEVLDELADVSPPVPVGELLTGPDPQVIARQLREALPNPARPRQRPLNT